MTGETLWQRLWAGAWRWRGRADWDRLLGRGWPDRIMDVAVTDRFHAKQGRSTGRWVLDADGRRLAVYLKRHYRLPRWRGWLALLWPNAGWSPALEESRHLDWARAQGIPVPAVVAAGEQIGPWGRLRSFLAVEELTGMLPLHEAIPAAAGRLDAPAFLAWKRGLVAELARLSAELHRRRHFHKDLYLCHFYVPAEDTGRLPEWCGRVHMIDLHRLGHHPWMWRLWQVKDLAQLLYSSDVVGVTARDRLRFWRHYLAAVGAGRAAGWLRRCVEFKYCRYRRHNAKRRAKARGAGPS